MPLPLPPPVTLAGPRRPARGANFHIANGAAIVPTFTDPPGPGLFSTDVIARSRSNR